MVEAMTTSSTPSARRDPNGRGTSRIHLQLLVGSTREGRAADRVLPWLVDRVEHHGAFDLEVLDLRDWDLPLFQETAATLGDGYSTADVRRWNETIAGGDAYLFLTPEYNHSTSGVLKNAIDTVFASHAFRNKPAGFVGYSAGLVGGARAVEHLAHIAIEAEMAPLRNAELLAQVHQGFDGGEQPVDEASDWALTVLLDDLEWWGTALNTARAAGELAPARSRRRAA
jgi:NAD(P)H-dependent FMN reductase